MKIVIIEDEPLMAEALQEEILAIDSTIEILALLPSIKQTLAYLEKNGFPDLFFSDIELADGLSFEIFKKTESTTPVIFCTAYNHYAMEAFRVHSVDYILKPFDTDTIQNALEKYKTSLQNQEKTAVDFQSILSLINEKKTAKKRSILVHKGENIIPIHSKNIALAELKNGITYLHTFDKKRYTVQHNIEKLHSLLGDDFCRVNRQFIIRREAVEHVSQYFARKLLVKPSINFSEQIIVSKANATNFLRWLES